MFTLYIYSKNVIHFDLYDISLAELTNKQIGNHIMHLVQISHNLLCFCLFLRSIFFFFFFFLLFYLRNTFMKLGVALLEF